MIKNNLRHYLLKLEKKFCCLSILLSKLEILYMKEKFIKYSREYSKLAKLVTCWRTYKTLEIELLYNKKLYNENDNDLELRFLIIEELNNIKSKLVNLKKNIKKTLIKTYNKEDKHGIFLELRYGAGGSEAALFVGDLFRMYSKYAEKNNWKIEVISFSSGEYGGFKEIILRIKGYGIYGKLKFESGTHRVQRIPNTEALGRVHTSTCTVVVMAELKKALNLKINIEDLRIDTYRSSGAGGQHVNTTDSAVRITHLPTNIVVECQTERSQHSNKERAILLLKAKLQQKIKEEFQKKQTKIRKTLIGSGDRSERIRTYNYSQGRVTDHRINLTIYDLNNIIDGNLDEIINPLINEVKSEQLMSIS
ncbi:Peptide chain release factor 1 [Candidatus Portiera aleyrodidarum]|uniref:Peptide chain release factor 1 n=1 Tax=Candidatus Portiera aleyrodidarum TaxID=91844 RepID=A0A6S6S632_9GAMM|nr:peptide chain release factor 1 [Candidatus Portiera aleyrodidarum]CAA3707424.1 Peptide chain release factor 1 [Candidatus Portiera aleyrodidarum]